jgi:hypothetical protein
MPHLLLVPARTAANQEQAAALMGTTDLKSGHQFEVEINKDWLMGATHRIDAPLQGTRTYSDDRWTLVFAGDLVDHDTVPFHSIIDALATGNFGLLAGLSGIFAIAAHDRVGNKVFAVSDRRGQRPLYYNVGSQQLYLSTSLAMFARFLDKPRFDKKWLWQSLYFNIPVDTTTFLADVKRMPAASVMTFDAKSQEMSIKCFVAPFERQDPLIGGQEALQLATEIFAKRVPVYYHGAEQVACALTAGWDGRMVLGLAPVAADVTAYTYGSPGCTDLVGAAAVAKTININHVPIPFDHSFIDDLPHHALETVYLSGGLQNVLRSTLHNIYDALTDSGRRFPLTISGIDIDGLFRGHAQTPHLVSPDLAALFEGAGRVDPSDNWRATIGADIGEFSDHVDAVLDSQEDQFGPFADSAHHLSYAIYPMANSLFGGELSVSDHFTTVRIPAWDPLLIELAYSIEQSTLSYSQFLSGYRRGSREEMVLQSHIFRELAPQFYRMPIGGTRPCTVLAGALPYQLERIYRGIKRRIQRRSFSPNEPPLENWVGWFFDDNRQFIDDLLRSPDTLVTDYVEQTFVDSTIATRKLRMLGKLLTTEIILRLIKTRWQRFW